MTVGPTKVCIVGGGPSGLALAKALNYEPHTFEIDLFEGKSQLGGIWSYFSQKNRFNSEQEIKLANENNYTPVYKHLETNLSPELMGFADVEFESDKIFPSHYEVKNYLDKYSETIGECNIHLNTKVVRAEKVDNQWKVTFKPKDGPEQIKIYDKIVAANGHFYKPFVPEVPGLIEWKEKEPLSVTHAKYFDDVDGYENKTVLVVGGFVSGADLALQLSKVAKKIYVSVKEDTALEKYPNPYIEIIPVVEKLDYGTKTAHLSNGRILENIDLVLFCTGYLYDIPFLNELDICRQFFIEKLYKQVFYIEDPSVTVIGLPRNVNPFPLIELQASVVARVYSGRLELPTRDIMNQDYLGEIKTRGYNKEFHNLKPPFEYEYFSGLKNMIAKQGLTEGLNALEYNERRFNLRETASATKEAYVKKVNEAILESRLQQFPK